MQFLLRTYIFVFVLYYWTVDSRLAQSACKNGWLGLWLGFPI